jgi:hypothetical protein
MALLSDETSGAGRALPDPFDTAGLRASVLGAWAASPTRFREDANAEEDLLLGGYADRWLVELAQNAADAARLAGESGRLLVRLVDGSGGPELRVANTGVPLDAAGVAALASLRASTKRDEDAVGRFGVGFAAVLGVTGEPVIASGPGGVAFSAARTAAEVAALGGVAAEELGRRDGRPPVLRLCWPLGAEAPGPPEGYQTEVRLPLDGSTGAPGALLAGVDEVAADLLLALPWLAEIVVHGPDGEVAHRRVEHPDGTVTLEPGGVRWRLTRRTGRLDGVAGRNGAAGSAVEDRSDWTVCWALPLDADGRPHPLEEDVLHAPTPSDEKLSLPARLLAALPMQPSRRRVRAGAATDAVLAEAAVAYRELVLSLAPADRLALAPRPGFPRSELDATLRERIAAELTDAAWLPTVRPRSADVPDAGPGRGPDVGPEGESSGVPRPGSDVRPADGVLLEQPAGPELTGLLAEVVPGLLDDDAVGSTGTATRAVLAGLGVRYLTLAGLADRLAQVRRPARWWGELYAALAPLADRLPTARDELAALPVPLVDGRTVTGPRTTLTLAGSTLLDDAGLLTALTGLDLPGLRIAHPAAAHPLLTRLGATEAGPAELLDHPSVADAVAESVTWAEDRLDAGTAGPDEDPGLAVGPDPAALARLVLGLLAELIGDDRGRAADVLAARPWLAALALPDADGEPCRADELVLPDAALRPLLVADAPVGVLAAEVAGAHPRAALAAVGVLDSFALVVDDRPTGPDHDLDDEDRWWDEPGEPARLVAVRDLDLVDDDAWPAALAVLAADPAYRAAWRDPAGYTAWWLARHARLAGRRPGHWRAPSATGLAGLYDPVPTEVLAALAARGSAVSSNPPPAAVELLSAIGVRTDTAVRDSADAAELMARLGDPARSPDAALTWAAHAELADAVLAGRVDPEALDPPERLRAVDGSVSTSERAVLLDRPWLAAALPPADTVPTRADPDSVDALAELLDLPLASEVVVGRLADGVAATGEERRWAELPEVVAACAAVARPVPDGSVWCHQRLTVELTRPESRRLDLPVWLQDGRWHAADPLRALLTRWSLGPELS